MSGPQGTFWGRHGAAGLLVLDRAGRVLLQLRAPWCHHGGTWGLPGGALRADESEIGAAFREAREEAGVRARSLRVVDTMRYDVGYWSYTTVLARPVGPLGTLHGNDETVELRWVDADDVPRLELHPGLASSWDALRRRIDRLGAGPAQQSRGGHTQPAH